MNVLLLGSGGREHALAWKMRQSTLCGELYIAPGNAGTAQCGTNVNLKISDFQAIGRFCIDHRIDMVVVGPEQPLVDGVVDYFKADPTLKNIQIIGPSTTGAQLEGSKSFAKAFMHRHHIPTAAYFEATQENRDKALAYIAQHDCPIVLKADGLAAGKGVLICQDQQEAQVELQKMLDGKFGEASEKVVIESFLSGLEFSVFVLTNGSSYRLLPIAKDYKRIGETDTGLNTGGMGAISPVPFVDEEMMQKVTDRIIHPTLVGLQEENIEYKGFIFFGLIEVDGDPYVIEYNCRLGDPETEAIIPRIKDDLLGMFSDIEHADFGLSTVSINPQYCATVMLVSGGYPGDYEKGKEIFGLDHLDGSLPFLAGAKAEEGRIYTNGGRVIAISSLGDGMKDALDLSYFNAEKIRFDKKYYRKDIGFDLFVTA